MIEVQLHGAAHRSHHQRLRKEEDLDLVISYDSSESDSFTARLLRRNDIYTSRLYHDVTIKVYKYLLPKGRSGVLCQADVI